MPGAHFMAFPTFLPKKQLHFSSVLSRLFSVQAVHSENECYAQYSQRRAKTTYADRQALVTAWVQIRSAIDRVFDIQRL